MDARTFLTAPVQSFITLQSTLAVVSANYHDKQENIYALCR